VSVRLAHNEFYDMHRFSVCCAGGKARAIHTALIQLWAVSSNQVNRSGCPEGVGRRNVRRTRPARTLTPPHADTNVEWLLRRAAQTRHDRMQLDRQTTELQQLQMLLCQPVVQTYEGSIPALANWIWQPHEGRKANLIPAVRKQRVSHQRHLPRPQRSAGSPLLHRI